jgi:hypothetical protein
MEGPRLRYLSASPDNPCRCARCGHTRLLQLLSDLDLKYGTDRPAPLQFTGYEPVTTERPAQ